MNNLKYYIPGLVLIFVAILIVAVPEILVAFVASLIIMAGIGALYLGHRMRKFDYELRHGDNWYSEEDFFGSSFLKRPIFRDWRRHY